MLPETIGLIVVISCIFSVLGLIFIVIRNRKKLYRGCGLSWSAVVSRSSYKKN